MVSIDSDYKAMMEQLESGDNFVLTAIADWYEERGDPLAKGFRRIVEEGKYPYDWIQTESTVSGQFYYQLFSKYSWTKTKFPLSTWCYVLDDLFSYLLGEECGFSWMDYPSRYEAFLDLARAYAKDNPTAH